MKAKHENIVKGTIFWFPSSSGNQLAPTLKFPIRQVAKLEMLDASRVCLHTVGSIETGFVENAFRTRQSPCMAHA
jgi:hypothetical protein